MGAGAAIVLDVGKTISKLSLWTLDGQPIRRAQRANMRQLREGVGLLDVEGISEWVIATLSEFSSLARVRHIIPVAHGAGLAVLRDDELAFPPLDYEQPIPPGVLDDYQAQRDAFEVTGSPALPNGLNAAVQLHWLEGLKPGVLETATIVPWAQYWSWFLSGEARSEVSSLGCHTDLWEPAAKCFSPMARRRGWAERFAPITFAGDAIGRISPAIADATGLPRDVQIHCGLHDSNAALVAAMGSTELDRDEATVLSTGTWFVAMRIAKEPCGPGDLPRGRDCLVNVNPWGRPTPSARFMGGREIESLVGVDTRRVDIKPDQPALLRAVAGVILSESMILPTFAAGFGPFSDGSGEWLNAPEDGYARRAAACLYAALVSDSCIELVGSTNMLLVEGRFAEAEVFVRALASLRPDMRVYTSHAHNDVSFGALRLLNPDIASAECLELVAPLPEDLTAYRDEWRRRTLHAGIHE